MQINKENYLNNFGRDQIPPTMENIKPFPWKLPFKSPNNWIFPHCRIAISSFS